MPNTGKLPGATQTSPSAIGRFDPVFSERRVFYADAGLDEADLAPTPLEQFRRWYTEAAASPLIVEPNAMSLATVDGSGTPAARTVLLKGADPRGFAFFTNHSSRKGRQLAADPRAAALFGWVPLHRQVALHGPVERLPAAESAAYFRSRPWASRIGAWASRQSEPVGSRAELEERWLQLAERWPDTGRDDDVPVPDFWGGYLLRPVEVEFWAGRPSRLHDRLIYLPTGPVSMTSVPKLDDPTSWRVERRQP